MIGVRMNNYWAWDGARLPPRGSVFRSCEKIVRHRAANLLISTLSVLTPHSGLGRYGAGRAYGFRLATPA